MLTNKEFARLNRVPEELSAEMDEFAAFTIDLGACVGDDGNPIFPKLEGRGVHLWEVTPTRDGMTMTELKKFDEEQRELDRQAQLALYIKRGYAFDERAVTDPQGGEDEDEQEEAPQDEWEKFFAEDERPRHISSGRHNVSRVRGTAGFESFVDAAQ